MAKNLGVEQGPATGSSFGEQAASIHLHFPKLRGVTQQGRTIVVGEIDVVDRDGRFWESFQIEIHPVDDFPFRYPHVYETGGKIPKIGDWHVFENTLRCCLDVEPEEIIKCHGGLSLVDFIRSEMLPYFFNQTFRRQEGYYPNGEYEHNVYGIFQYYDRLVQSGGNPRVTIQQMMFLLRVERPGRTHVCFCGSGKKFRYCHRQALDTIKKLGNQVVIYHARQIANEFKLIS